MEILQECVWRNTNNNNQLAGFIPQSSRTMPAVTDQGYREFSMRRIEGGGILENYFGRHLEREHLKRRLRAGDGVILLFGQPLVGKASLAFQVAEELKEEFRAQDQGALTVYSVHCKNCKDWPDVMRAMCQALSLNETNANENLIVSAVTSRIQPGCTMLLLLLKLDHLSVSGFDLDCLKRCLNILALKNVVTLLTSRRPLQLQSTQLVEPLTQTDAMEILRHYVRGVNTTGLDDVVKTFCHGLPPLILRMAHLMEGNELYAFNAEDLRHHLNANPGLLLEGFNDEARLLYDNFSTEVKNHVTNLAHLLNGSFSVETLQIVLGLPEGASTKCVLRKLCEESPLTIDNSTRRMSLQPLILHHVRRIGHVSADDQARLRVLTFLGRILIQAERDMYIEGQDTIYGHLHGDWPHLQHLLRQAIHCTVNTYPAYLQVALGADKLLVKCFPEECLQFYHDMSSAAVRFGTRQDQAVLQGLIGMAVTQAQGTGWEESLQYFLRALPVLRENRRSIHFLRLLIDMGVTYFRLNKLQDAERCLKDAVHESVTTQTEDEKQLIHLLVRARSILALPTIFRGHWCLSKELVKETLEMCSELAPHHPDKPVLINSMGLIFERSGESQDMAMHYYMQSLVERRRYSVAAPADLVPPLNNIGMQFARRQNYVMAMQHLEEAAAIRARCGRWHYYTALTQQHLGQVCLQRGDIKRAEGHLQEAAIIYARCTPGHDIRSKVALTLAHIYITPPCRDVGSARQQLAEACKLADESKDISDAGLLIALSAVEHRIQLAGWNSKEIPALLQFAEKHLAHFDGDFSTQMNEHRSILDGLAELSRSDHTNEDTAESLTLRILMSCQLCTAIGAHRDARTLWKSVTNESGKIRSALDRLRGSPALTEAFRLSALSQQEGTDSNARTSSLPTKKSILNPLHKHAANRAMELVIQDQEQKLSQSESSQIQTPSHADLASTNTPSSGCVSSNVFFSRSSPLTSSSSNPPLSSRQQEEYRQHLFSRSTELSWFVHVPESVPLQETARDQGELESKVHYYSYPTVQNSIVFREPALDVGEHDAAVATAVESEGSGKESKDSGKGTEDVRKALENESSRNPSAQIHTLNNAESLSSNVDTLLSTISTHLEETNPLAVNSATAVESEGSGKESNDFGKGTEDASKALENESSRNPFAQIHTLNNAESLSSSVDTLLSTFSTHLEETNPLAVSSATAVEPKANLSIQLPIALETLSSCAQVLVSALQSKCDTNPEQSGISKLVTEDQRRALDKLASFQNNCLGASAASVTESRRYQAEGRQAAQENDESLSFKNSTDKHFCLAAAKSSAEISVLQPTSSSERTERHVLGMSSSSQFREEQQNIQLAEAGLASESTTAFFESRPIGPVHDSNVSKSLVQTCHFLSRTAQSDTIVNNEGQCISRENSDRSFFDLHLNNSESVDQSSLGSHQLMPTLESPTNHISNEFLDLHSEVHHLNTLDTTLPHQIPSLEGTYSHLEAPFNLNNGIQSSEDIQPESGRTIPDLNVIMQAEASSSISYQQIHVGTHPPSFNPDSISDESSINSSSMVFDPGMLNQHSELRLEREGRRLERHQRVVLDSISAESSINSSSMVFDPGMLNERSELRPEVEGRKSSRHQREATENDDHI